MYINTNLDMSSKRLPLLKVIATNYYKNFNNDPTFIALDLSKELAPFTQEQA